MPNLACQSMRESGSEAALLPSRAEAAPAHPDSPMLGALSAVMLLASLGSTQALSVAVCGLPLGVTGGGPSAATVPDPAGSSNDCSCVIHPVGKPTKQTTVPLVGSWANQRNRCRPRVAVFDESDLSSLEVAADALIGSPMGVPLGGWREEDRDAIVIVREHELAAQLRDEWHKVQLHQVLNWIASAANESLTMCESSGSGSTSDASFVGVVPRELAGLASFVKVHAGSASNAWSEALASMFLSAPESLLAWNQGQWCSEARAAVMRAVLDAPRHNSKTADGPWSNWMATESSRPIMGERGDSRRAVHLYLVPQPSPAGSAADKVQLLSMAAVISLSTFVGQWLFHCFSVGGGHPLATARSSHEVSSISRPTPSTRIVASDNGQGDTGGETHPVQQKTLRRKGRAPSSRRVRK